MFCRKKRENKTRSAPLGEFKIHHRVRGVQHVAGQRFFDFFPRFSRRSVCSVYGAVTGCPEWTEHEHLTGDGPWAQARHPATATCPRAFLPPALGAIIPAASTLWARRDGDADAHHRVRVRRPLACRPPCQDTQARRPTTE